MRNFVKKQNGITLIALVVTIIVLIILAGVSIAMLVGDNGIITQAQRAAQETEQAQRDEEAGLSSLETAIQEALGNVYNEEKGVNAPKLAEGMTPIKFTEPTDTEKGTVVETTSEDADWYDYEAKNWANAQTEDGSMWVWIPRFAYRVNSSTQTFDVVFLVGTTDTYYDENGEPQTAKRCTSEDQAVDTTTGFTVHPAFTDETAINYRNGGWDKEITGIWVAKFEAGYASGNNNAEVKASSVKYTQASAYVPNIESEAGDITTTARNWLDGEYGKKLEDGSYTWLNGEVAIKYPTFQGKTYAMNYINTNDAFNITRALNEIGNIYGLSTDSDSHLMKNSEWGAVAYLGQSQYGLNGTNVYVNNANLNNSEKSVYAVTGMCSAENADKEAVTTTIENINSIDGNTPQDNLYTWDQLEGQKASSTGTIYGVYDMSGGTWEKTAGYVANGNENLKNYGRSLTYDGETLKTGSTKYTTVYPYSSEDKNGVSLDEIDTLSQDNYEENKMIYGDGIRETSKQGTSSNSWYNDYSVFPGLSSPFTMRGGRSWLNSSAGLFAFSRATGDSGYSHGFRAVLCVQ